MTFGAVVYECTVPARMWVTPGPPHLNAFRQVAWSSTQESVELRIVPCNRLKYRANS